MKKLLQFIRYAVNLPLYRASLLIPSDPCIWLFGARQGRAYAENSRHLFEHVNRHRPDIRAVWLTKDRHVLKRVRAMGYTCFMSSSIMGYWHTARAGAVFITHFNTQQYDLNFYVIKPGTPIIQLWHGSPLKKIIYDRQGSGFNTFSEGRIQRLLIKIFPFHRHKFEPDAVIAASDPVAGTLASAFSIPSERILITGYPRNDTMLKTTVDRTEQGPIKILCAPTFRDRDIPIFSGYGFDPDSLNRFCADRGIEFYLRPHPYSSALKTTLLQQEDSQWKHLFLHENEDLHFTLGDFDMLVTDYSSILFDYLLLDRPVILIPFDIDRYRREEFDFYHDYDRVTPGPLARDWKEVMLQIDRFIKDPGLFREERTRVSFEFNLFTDSGSAERIIEAVQQLSGKSRQ